MAKNPKKSTRIRVDESSGNVFADLGLPNPERELLNAGVTASVPTRRTFVICALLLSVAAGCSDDAEHRILLDSLVRNGASEREVVKQLGAGVQVSDRRNSSWADLQKFLDREPASHYVPVREAMEKYPRILFYSTAWRMTWIFIDEHGVIRGYYLTSQ